MTRLSMPIKIGIAVFLVHFLLVWWLWSSWQTQTELYFPRFMVQHGITQENPVEMFSHPEFSPPTPNPLLRVLIPPLISMAIIRTGGVFTLLDHLAQSALWGFAAFLLARWSIPRRARA